MARQTFTLKENESGGMELELPNHHANHPDNNRLEKRVTGDDYSPLDNSRTCTDVCFLLLIICSWVAMTGLGLAATGIVPSEYIKQGDPSRLVNGLDYHGNICGITNYVTPSGKDVIDLPKAYPLPSGLFVCVESCPSANDFDEFICEYEVQQEIEETLATAAQAGATIADSSEKSMYLFYTGQKQCMPKIESSSFLGYCVPSKPLEDVLVSDSKSTNNVNASQSNSTDTISNTTSNTNETAIAVSAEKKAASSNEAFDIIMADVLNARFVVFSFGIGIAMALGIIFLVVIQLPGLLSLLVWSMITAVGCGLAGAGYYTKGVSATWEASGRPGNEALALYYGSYVLYGFAGLWLIIILFLRKRILLAISCVKEAARAISAMPLMTVFPVVQVLLLFAFTVIWVVYMAYLASSGEISASCFCPENHQDFPGFGGNDSTPAPSPVATIEPTLTVTNGSEGGICTAECFMYKELTYSTNTKYAALYMIFVWFWTSQFIVAVGQLVVALSVCLWYFNRDRNRVGNSTFLKSTCLVLVYHLGTAAFGSLIIAIVKTIRAVLTYVQKKASKSRLRLAIILLKVIQCLLWCLEKCLKFINKQAYIQTAIFSYSFCKAARMGFFLILRNALRISAVSIVSQVVLFINKIFITVASTASGYYYLQMNYGDQLNSLMAPTLLIAICSYAVSEMFDEVFGMAISTILQCFVADEEMFEPEERFAPSSLASTLETTQQKIKKNKASTVGIQK